MANIKLKKTISPRVLSVSCKILRQVGVSETELAVGHTEVWREKADGQACVYESVTRTKTDTVSLCLHTHHKEWIDYRIERERERESECMDDCRFLWSKKLETAAQLPDNTPPLLFSALIPYSSRVPSSLITPPWSSINVHHPTASSVGVSFD
jgi:hypothetical protein